MPLRSAGLLALAPLLISCAQPPATPTSAPAPGSLAAPSQHYADPASWLCLPGRSDACSAPLDATELLADGSRALAPEPAAVTGGDVDCFYVYPTVDLSLAPANHQAFADLTPMTHVAQSQAARFRSACRVFAPLYRQATLGAYLRDAPSREEYLRVAESDVVDAFLHYLQTENHGRSIVLVGHSQGAEMVTRLLRRFFDDDPKLRARLLVALPIGGHLEVAAGQTTGGTFEHIPMCTHPDETGCVVGYRSYEADAVKEGEHERPAPGHETLCVNPATLDNPVPHPFARSYFPLRDDVRTHLHGVDGLSTPFVMVSNFYTGQCAATADGFHYLAVSLVAAAGDRRENPVDFRSKWLRGLLGLHVLDLQLEQGDLIDLVARRVRARQRSVTAP